MGFSKEFLGVFTQQPIVAASQADVPPTVSDRTTDDILYAILQVLGGGSGNAFSLFDAAFSDNAVYAAKYFDGVESYVYSIIIFNTTNAVIKVDITDTGRPGEIQTYIIPSNGSVSIQRNKISQQSLGNQIETSVIDTAVTSGLIIVNYTY